MNRITSIDATRGLVMLLMLVDHTREFFFMHAQVSDPVDVITTSPALFFTRLAAHLCAPVFVGLTGLAAWLYYQKQNSLQKASEFLFKRGLILVLFELTIINFGWTFSFPPTTLYLQVIWAIGLSMIAMSALIRLPRAWLIGLGLTIVLGHNLLDFITFSEGEPGHALWAIIHDRSYISVFEGLKIRTSYPVLPWIGVMALGFSIGPWFGKTVTQAKRVHYLWKTAAASLLLFLILRATNIYGDAFPWKLYGDFLTTIMSFLNLTKYPPSADFILFTMAIGLFVMGLFEKWSGKVNSVLSTYGSVPLFYYIVHIYILNLINTILKTILGPNQGEYLSVPSVMYLWIITFALAFPLWYICKWYGGVKKRHPNSYLKYL